MKSRTLIRNMLVAGLPAGWSVGAWRSDRLVASGPDGAELIVTDTPTDLGVWKGWDLIVSEGPLCEYGGDVGYWRTWARDIAREALAAVARIGTREVCARCEGHGIEANNPDYSCRACRGAGVIAGAA